jgi:hypothetical protein
MRERFGSTSLFMAGASRLLGKEEEKKEKQLDALFSLLLMRALWPRLNTLFLCFIKTLISECSRDFFQDAASIS